MSFVKNHHQENEIPMISVDNKFAEKVITHKTKATFVLAVAL